MTVPILDCLTHISEVPDDVIGWLPEEAVQYGQALLSQKRGSF